MIVNKFLMLFLFLLFQSSLLAQVTEEWVRRYNNQENGPDHSHDLAVDNIGNVYVTGHSNFINSWPSYDYITVKYNNQGTEQWVARYTGQFRFDDAYAIAVDNSGNVYVTGSSETSPFVNDFLTIKYNSDGIEQWTRRYNGSLDSNDEAYGVIIDNNGDILVTGMANYGTQFSEGILIKYSPNGSVKWIKNFKGGIGVTIADNSSNLLISGHILFKLNSLGSVLWNISDTLTYYGVLKIENNQNFLATKIKYTNPQNMQIFISRYTQNGNLIWEAPLIGQFSDLPRSLTTDLQGNIYGGYLRDTSGQQNLLQYTVVKFSPSGEFQWQRTFTGGFYYGNIRMKTDQHNKLYIIYAGGIGDYTDFVTMKMDEFGNTLWQMTYNGSANYKDSPGGIVLDNQGNVFVTGYSEALVTGLDYCVVKYSQSDTTAIQPISSEIPNSFSLSQNYPNPFNPVTKIRFSIPLSRGVSEGRGVLLKVFDILGREVATLVNWQLKPGTYEVSWDAANYPSGVYFYKLITDKYIASKKMILVK